MRDVETQNRETRAQARYRAFHFMLDMTEHERKEGRGKWGRIATNTDRPVLRVTGDERMGKGERARQEAGRKESQGEEETGEKDPRAHLRRILSDRRLEDYETPELPPSNQGVLDPGVSDQGVSDPGVENQGIAQGGPTCELPPNRDPVSQNRDPTFPGSIHHTFCPPSSINDQGVINTTATVVDLECLGETDDEWLYGDEGGLVTALCLSKTFLRGEPRKIRIALAVCPSPP